MISFAKMKGVEPLDSTREEYRPSLTLKCLFGMIPHPQRTIFHGLNHSELSQNIVDINKIYHALFNVVGINEALHTCMVSDPNGPYKANWGSCYDVIKNAGLVAFGRDLVNLDAFTCKLLGKYPERVPYLRLATKAFGEWDTKLREATTPELRVKYQGPTRDQSPAN